MVTVMYETKCSSVEGLEVSTGLCCFIAGNGGDERRKIGLFWLLSHNQGTRTTQQLPSALPTRRKRPCPWGTTW